MIRRNNVVDKSIVRTLLFVLIALTPFLAVADEIRIKSFSMQMEPMTVEMQRKDNNGEVCALVKVIIPTAQATFEGNLIGRSDYKTSEYWCYLSPGSKQLKVKYPKCEPLMIDISDSNAKGIKGKTIYQLVISVIKDMSAGQETLTDSIMSKLRIEKYLTNISTVNPKFIHPKRGRLYPFQKDGLWGFLDDAFQVVIPSAYSDLQNDVLIKNQYECSRWMDSRESFQWEQDFYWVKKNNLWGCIDENGNTLIPFKYKDMFEPNEGYDRCRLCFVTDTLDNHFIIDRLTGEKYQTVGKWGYHKNSRYSKSYRTQSLFHVPSMGKSEDVFVDKITGKIVDIKLGKGYEFRYFMPFRHLYVYNGNRHDSKVLNYQGKIVFDNRVDYPRECIETHDFEYLFSFSGIYSLESEQYIYNQDARDAMLLNDDIVELRYGVHKTYYDLKKRKVLTDLPDDWNVVKPKYWNILAEVWELEKGRDYHISDISKIDDSLFLCNCESGDVIIIIDKYGNYGKLENSVLEFGVLNKYFDKNGLSRSLNNLK